MWANQISMSFELTCVNSSGAHIEYIAEDIFRIFQDSRIDPIARRDSQLFYWLLLVVRAISQPITSHQLMNYSTVHLQLRLIRLAPVNHSMTDGGALAPPCVITHYVFV